FVLTVSVSGQNLFEPSIEQHTLTIIAQDRGGNEVTRTITFTTGYADVKVVIKPEALNINPGVLTVYAKLPEPFGIPLTLTATLDGAPLDNWMVSYEDMPAEPSGVPTNVGKEGLTAPIVIMKFRRQDIEKALAEKGEVLDTKFILKGTFTESQRSPDYFGNDGTAPSDLPYQFEGRDSITKIIAKESTSSGSSEQSSDNKGEKKK
ncbi:MAG: hypothetical protein QME51_07895, partial [Planctomycetota bacterium]|nr:hypothetical protein [Planctomycetota bacterium]